MLPWPGRDDGAGRIGGAGLEVYETKPSPAPLVLSGGRKPMPGSSGSLPVAGSMVVKIVSVPRNTAWAAW